MKANPTLAILLGLFVVALALVLATLPCDAQQRKSGEDALHSTAVQDETADRIHRLRARVRHTTLIVLPAGERILDFVVGDSEYWHLTGAANVAYLKPLAKNAKTNVALVCESGRIYSFLAAEDGSKPPHLVVRIEPGDGSGGAGDPNSSNLSDGAPAFVARSEVAAYREMAAEAAESARRAQRLAEDAVAQAEADRIAANEAFRAEYPTRLAFEYKLDGNAAKRPFLVEAMWHDGEFTYLRSRAQEAPALYELRDGKPALVAFDLAADGLYVARRVLADGWLRIGEKRADWRFEPRGEASR